MLQVPIDPTNGKIVFPKVGTTHEERIVAENYPDGTILQPFNGSMTHWEFIGNPNNNRYGLSCAASVMAYKKA